MSEIFMLTKQQFQLHVYELPFHNFRKRKQINDSFNDNNSVMRTHVFNSTAYDRYTRIEGGKDLKELSRSSRPELAIALCKKVSKKNDRQLANLQTC